ncbi:MAG TPA: helix-turn-helix domain-containing protein [Egibacteraceae bacterium]|nr:helix-turn-helix domain-containing protein [Egibacteraceae bacterium]
MTTHDTADPLEALRALQERERELEDARRLCIARARMQGRSWSEIGAALGVSKQAAWQLFNDDITAMLDRISDRSGLSEDEAMRIAQEELAAVRRQRRPRTAS